MRLGYRIVIALYAFLFSVLALGLVLATAGWETPYQYVEFALTDPKFRWVTGVAAGLVFLLGIWSLLGSVQKAESSHAFVQSTSLGEIRITLSALENIVRRAALQVKGIREVKTRIKSSPDGVAFLLQVTVLPGVSVPAITGQLQENVSAEVQHNAGIQVLEVRVLVENMTAEAKARVE